VIRGADEESVIKDIDDDNGNKAQSIAGSIRSASNGKTNQSSNPTLQATHSIHSK